MMMMMMIIIIIISQSENWIQYSNKLGSGLKPISV